MNKSAGGNFFVCVRGFLKKIYIFSCTFDLYRKAGDKKGFHPVNFWKQNYFF